MDEKQTLGGYFYGWLLEYIYDPAEKKAQLAYRDPNRNMGVADSIEINGTQVVPKEVNRLIDEGGVLFASELGEKMSTSDLVATVSAFIQKHILLPNSTARLIAYYVLMTWVYDGFSAVPYLRVTGARGTGKTELANRVGHICYRSMPLSKVGSALQALRFVDTYRGTAIIDGGHEDGGLQEDIRKMLNTGAMRGNPIIALRKADGGENYEPVIYSTYGPKLIVDSPSYRDRDESVIARCITIGLAFHQLSELQDAGIKLYIDNKFQAEAQVIRNLLLRWRLEIWEQEFPIRNEIMVKRGVSSQSAHLLLPLMAIAENDVVFRREIHF